MHLQGNEESVKRCVKLFWSAANVFWLTVITGCSSNTVCSLISTHCGKSSLLLSAFIYFWMRWVFVAACGLSLVAVLGILIPVTSLVTERGP